MTHLPQRVILIIEDFPSDGDLYRRCLLALGCRYAMLENSLEGTLAPSRSFAPQSLDCILLSSNGLKGLAQLNDQMGDRCPPIVMIADDEDVTIAVQAIKQGAEDYLIKHKTTPDQLRMAIQTAIANAELKQKSKRSEKRFRTSVENMLDCFGIYSAIRDRIEQIIDFRIDYLNAAALESSCLKTAESVQSAFEILQQTQPDLVISDIGMPEADGYTLLSQIRQLVSEQRNTSAIASTAHAKPEDRDRALDAGFQDHLTKPVEPDDLIRAIVYLLRP
ncbi:MAG: response regulator [Phormidesmis sp. CAN_BIN44]|nr:response regulator [Phormidesmis sp. CAN_BIN44]